MAGVRHETVGWLAHRPSGTHLERKALWPPRRYLATAPRPPRSSTPTTASITLTVRSAAAQCRWCCCSTFAGTWRTGTLHSLTRWRRNGASLRSTTWVWVPQLEQLRARSSRWLAVRLPSLLGWTSDASIYSASRSAASLPRRSLSSGLTWYGALYWRPQLRRAGPGCMAGPPR